MKLRMITVMAGLGVLGSMTAWAQATDDTQPAPVQSPPAAEPPPVVPNVAAPSVVPDVDQPVSPATPVQPGAMPPMVTPQALPPPAPPVPVEEGQMRYQGWMSHVGAAMMLGGGFEDFTYANVKAMTGSGGSWDARLVGGTRQFVGLEAAYIGAARSIQTLGLASNTNLVSNGVEGALRINIPIVQGETLVEPFGFAGVGWQHYSLTHAASNTSDLTGSDDILEVPYGGGLEVSYRMLMLDARFTYRQTYMNDLLKAEGGKLNTWGVGGNVGVEF
jgi:hypothetical protein